MIRRLFRFAVKFGAVASAVAVAAKVFGRRRSASSDWSTPPEPWPPLDDSQQLADAAASEPDPVVVTQDAGAEVNAGAGATDAPGSGSNGPAVWTDPGEGGICPATHPVKAKLSSGVFHLPGMANYERTHADRCYPDADAAVADGLRQAKH